MTSQINFRKIVLITIIIGIFLLFISFESNAQNVIDEARSRALELLGPDRLGSAYAAMINFSVHPDISAATYYIDSDSADNPTLNVYRIPLQYVFKLDEHDWRPLVRANFAYQTFESGFNISPGERVDSAWRTYGGSLSIGVEVPVNKNFVLVPVINSGVVHIYNEADYHGTLSNIFLKPALDGLLFNWDADAWLIGVALGGDYRRKFKKFDFSASGSLTYNYIETFQSSSKFIKFDSDAMTFDINLEAVIPTGKRISVYPLAIVLTAGYTTFLGGNRDALGFEYFYEAGLAIENDLSEKGWKLKKVRFGAKAIFGDNLTGWSLILGYRF